MKKPQPVATNAASSALGIGQGTLTSEQMTQEEIERRKKVMAAAGGNPMGYGDPSGNMAGAASALGLAGRRM